jgi:hypothetical protein
MLVRAEGDEDLRDVCEHVLALGQSLVESRRESYVFLYHETK